MCTNIPGAKTNQAETREVGQTLPRCSTKVINISTMQLPRDGIQGGLPKEEMETSTAPRQVLDIVTEKHLSVH